MDSGRTEEQKTEEQQDNSEKNVKNKTWTST